MIMRQVGFSDRSDIQTVCDKLTGGPDLISRRSPQTWLLYPNTGNSWPDSSQTLSPFIGRSMITCRGWAIRSPDIRRSPQTALVASRHGQAGRSTSDLLSRGSHRPSRLVVLYSKNVVNNIHAHTRKRLTVIIDVEIDRKSHQSLGGRKGLERTIGGFHWRYPRRPSHILCAVPDTTAARGRAKSVLSQTEFAGLSGVSRGTLEQCEQGRRARPRR